MNKDKNCTECGTIIPYKGDRTSICSPECYLSRRNKWAVEYYKKNKEEKQKECLWCKMPFIFTLRGKKLYCSATCTYNAKLEKNKAWRESNAQQPRVHRPKKKTKKKQVQSTESDLRQLKIPFAFGT